MSVVEFSPSWGRTVGRMARMQSVVLEQGSMLMYWAQQMGIKTAQEQLDFYVYNAPLPPSAATDPGYLDRARTGRTRQAITGRAIGLGAFSAEIFVDSTDYPAYYYAWTLNYGGFFTRPGYYAARPFWTTTRAIMEVRLYAEARKKLWNIKMSVIEAGS